jgi:tRNA A37 threonylcarbamoyladenosine modification protein TsaB
MISSRLKHYKVEYLQKALPKRYDLLVVPIATPMMIGVYEEGYLIETMASEVKISEALLPLLQHCIHEYPLSSIIYTRGPGSYMSIKLTYIMLKSIEILFGIPCVGCSGFSLNGGAPIKAVGNLYFIKEKKTIITQKYEQPLEVSFILPRTLHSLELDEKSEPDYVLPAV